MCLPSICRPETERSPMRRMRRPVQFRRTRSRSLATSTCFCGSLSPLARRGPGDIVEATVSPTLSATPDTTRQAERSPSLASGGMAKPDRGPLSPPEVSSSDAPRRGPAPSAGPLWLPGAGCSCPRASAIRRLASAVSILPAARSSRMAVISALMTSTLRVAPTHACSAARSS
nr:hypothetical protein [Cutibacterium avidum]